MAEDDATKWRVEFHKALSNPNRLEILDTIGDEERCQCEIFPEIDLSQSTVSAYLSQIVRAGILEERRSGSRKYYRISDPRFREIIKETKALARDMTGNEN